MANRTQVIKQFDQRRIRSFSIEFKKKIVSQIEKNLISVGEVAKEYDVSRTSVYKWVYLYSSLYKKGLKQVIQPMSENEKIKKLKAQIKELEQLVGRKQIEIELKDKMMDLAEDIYDIDFKKKLGSKRSSGSGNTGKDTAGA